MPTRTVLRRSLLSLALLGLSSVHARPAEAGGTGSRSVDAGARGGPPRRPYEGHWAADRRACLDPDSDQRMAIDGPGLYWYETRCRIRSASAAGPLSWRLDLACRGEGQRIRARARLSLPAPGRLVVEDGPIGPSRRQRYIRCDAG